jgi:general secretion pathway protein G
VGLLATVVLPQFSTENKQARQIALKDQLQYVRTQIAVFRAQHQDVSPGYPQGYPMLHPSVNVFAQQMTLHTDLNCNVSSTNSSAYPYGPYLKQLPDNPINNSSAVIVVPNDQPLPAPGGPAGWIYKPQTQEFIANLAGNDDTGIPYRTY